MLEEDVRRVGRLAHLRLDAAARARIQGELDTMNVEPMSHGGMLESPLREDSSEPSLSVAEALRNAPATEITSRSHGSSNE